MKMPLADLEDLLRRILEHHGCAPAAADVIARNCAGAERDGAASHGVFRMAGYVSSLKSGWVDGRAEPVIEDVAPGFLRADARNGFTLLATERARPALIAKARANGIAVLAVRNSHHLGALAPDVEPYATEGLIALSVINSMRSVAPAENAKAVLGTNPIAFAVPRATGEPLVYDGATSAMSHGDVQVAAREGRRLEPGSGLDRDGRGTTDPKAVLDGGAILPFGGHKGAALSLMVELLCAALVGGKFSCEIDLAAHPGAATPHSGQTIIAIDPSSGRGSMPAYADRVEDLLRALADSGVERLPGDRRLAARRRSADGIEISEDRVAELRSLLGLAAAR